MFASTSLMGSLVRSLIKKMFYFSGCCVRAIWLSWILRCVRCTAAKPKSSREANFQKCRMRTQEWLLHLCNEKVTSELVLRHWAFRACTLTPLLSHSAFSLLKACLEQLVLHISACLGLPVRLIWVITLKGHSALYSHLHCRVSVCCRHMLTVAFSQLQHPNGAPSPKLIVHIYARKRSKFQLPVLEWVQLENKMLGAIMWDLHVHALWFIYNNFLILVTITY